METITIDDIRNYNGWRVGIAAPDDLPVAIHADTGQVMDLEYRDRYGYWSTDWSCSRLDAHWGDTAALLTELRRYYRRGSLRVVGAIHGLPGASTLGALMI